MCLHHGLWRWYIQLPELQYWWLQVLLSCQTAHHWYSQYFTWKNSISEVSCLKSCRLIVILHDYRDMSILLLSEMCPNIGYVLVQDGHPKRCSLDFECISSSGEFSCVKNYCCPKDPSQGKVKQQSVCLYRAHANVSNIWINIACQINKVFPF